MDVVDTEAVDTEVVNIKTSAPRIPASEVASPEVSAPEVVALEVVAVEPRPLKPWQLSIPWERRRSLGTRTVLLLSRPASCSSYRAWFQAADRAQAAKTGCSRLLRQAGRG